MSEKTQQATSSGKVGFVSLGCPKALVDSERILTQLRLDGYDVVPSYNDADVVVVNTCGFIDAAKQESLDAIGEAISENGKVIVTGCMGADGDRIREAHPGVLAVSGPQAYEEVVGAVHQYVPPKKQHDPFTDLVPPQHASPRVLKAMKRPAHDSKTLERIKKWREICPELTIRSTFIVGFPGETEEDFQYLLDWLDEAQLDRVGAFTYSPVEGTPANELEGAVPEDVKEERLARFMEKQAEISAARLQARIGQTIDVLIDEVDEEGAIGRSKADAPEIDGMVYLNGEIDLQPGQIVQAVVEHADEHDLWASLM